MTRFRLLLLLPILVVACLLVLSPGELQAQSPVAVTAYYPAPLPAPVITYFPERRGLFGLQTVYRPVVTYAAPTPPPVVVAAPATRVYYAAPAPVTAYRVPARVVLPPPPVAVYYPPAPVVTQYAPVIVP